MRIILDTHLLLWSSEDASQLSSGAIAIIDDPTITLVFSVVSIWEVAIKRALARPDFQTDSRVLRRALLDNGYQELPVLGAHAVEVERLPLLHKDPFDRILIAQAVAEGITLATSDAIVARYPGSIRRV